MGAITNRLSLPSTRFALGLLLIAIAAVASHIVLVNSLSELDEDSIVINNSGRQRMLSEQTFRLASEFVAQSASSDAVELSKQLSASLALMRQTHERLAADVRQTANPTEWDRDLSSAYFGGDPSLDDRLSEYFVALEAIIETNPDALNADHPAYRQIANTHKGGILSDLDQVVKIYEGKAQARLQVSQNLHGQLMLGLLMLLIFEALFVFRPLIRIQARANDELREARDKAQSELAARTSVLAAVSHEIRTPMGGVLGIIDQLKRERSPAEQERALALIEDSSQALLETLDGILQQAGLSQDAAARDGKKFRPSAIAQRVAELFRPLARRKSIQIELRASSDAEVMGNPGRVQQVLANLVSNSVKFTQSGTVTIEVRPPQAAEANWTFVVSDTGIGIDQKRIEQIFEPFDTSGTDSLGRSVGAGLGLSITRDIVDAMGGQITVESNPGPGTSFTIEFPLAEVIEEATQAAQSSEVGNLYLALEKATEQVQAEATASKLGWNVLQLEDQPESYTANAGPVMILADSSRIASVTAKWLEASDRIYVLGESAAAGAIINENQEKTVLFPTGNLSGALQALMGSTRDGIA
ncbi:MAG: type IV pili methyl-accepting chemotaxis transducer N-terminal domain-containing protein [Altererythrobacter sp.]|nr:type IV pili methyl-accepting chemotaxis transducer N-terminal domain-containing protein [Altererythrobacter sp.]